MSDTDFHSLKNCFFTLLRMLLLLLLTFYYYLIHSFCSIIFCLHKLLIPFSPSLHPSLSIVNEFLLWKERYEIVKKGMLVTKVYVDWNLIDSQRWRFFLGKNNRCDLMKFFCFFSVVDYFLKKNFFRKNFRWQKKSLKFIDFKNSQKSLIPNWGWSCSIIFSQSVRATWLTVSFYRWSQVYYQSQIHTSFAYNSHARTHPAKKIVWKGFSLKETQKI